MLLFVIGSKALINLIDKMKIKIIMWSIFGLRQMSIRLINVVNVNKYTEL